MHEVLRTVIDEAALDQEGQHGGAPLVSSFRRCTGSTACIARFSGRGT
jgi:hypothetical protein